MLSSHVASDCTRLDGGETVELWLRRPDGIIVVPVTNALRRAATRQERSCDGVQLSGDETVWHIPHAPLPADRQLQPGDTIVAGEETWTIVTAERATLGTRWRCICRRQP